VLERVQGRMEVVDSRKNQQMAGMDSRAVGMGSRSWQGETTWVVAVVDEVGDGDAAVVVVVVAVVVGGWLVVRFEGVVGLDEVEDHRFALCRGVLVEWMCMGRRLHLVLIESP
jgi:hypothetical protein